MSIYTINTFIKEGRFLRNTSAATIGEHYTVVTPGSQIREVGLFHGYNHLGCDRRTHVTKETYFQMCPMAPPKIIHS